MNIRQFQNDRFGLFLHWGVYAIPARGEWVRNYDEMKEEDYLPFVKEFDPDAFVVENSGVNISGNFEKHLE